MLEASRHMTWEFTCQPCEWEVASSFFNFSTITSENLFLYSQSQHLYIEPWGYHCHPSQGWTQGDGGPRLSSLCTYRGAGGIPSGPKSRLRSSSPKLKNSPRIFNVYRNSVSIKYFIYLIWNDWKMSQSFQNHHWKTRKILEYMSASSWQLTKVHFPLLSWSGLWGVESLVMSCDGLHLLRLAHR